MMTRTEFAEYFNSIREGLGDPLSPLWCMEPELGRSNYFICIKTLKLSNFNRDSYATSLSREDFWRWVADNLEGSLLCYSSAEEEEWWGFSNIDDIFLFKLRWT